MIGAVFLLTPCCVLGVGGIIGIIVVLAIVVVVTSWFVFAYFNPQSRAGIWLIEVSPVDLLPLIS